MTAMSVTVLGAGSWGTAVAHLCAHNAPTVLWARDPLVAKEVQAEHRNSRYLPGVDLHPSLAATDDLGAAAAGADVLVVGVPSSAFRATLADAANYLRPWVPVVSLTKGLERASMMRMTQVADDVVPGRPVGVLTGPNLAKEVLAGEPAATVLAMSDSYVAAALQPLFATSTFRVFTNPDVVGCELGGALKNVVAIAAGIADGLGGGDNTRAAIITRGLAELTRLGIALGGQPLTFAGLAGMGDLIATCGSPQSRNRHVGEQLGRGRTLEEITAELDQVAEGVKSVPVVLALADQFGVPMPIAAQVHAVCFEGRSAADAQAALLSLPSRFELDGIA